MNPGRLVVNRVVGGRVVMPRQSATDSLRYASTPLAMLWTWGRVLRLADGPDEVHLRSVAKQEMQRSVDRRDALDAYLTPGANGVRAAA
jgi:acyl-CoA dehydrogenase